MITPEEKVETARVLLNGTVNRWRRERGLHELGEHLTIGDAVSALSSMRNMPTRRRRSEAEKQILKAAHWHQASLLSVYLDHTSEEYQRDLAKFGVYVIFELTPNGEVPLFVEAFPRYVGMSSVLSSRLKLHADGAPMSNPAENVLRDYLRDYATEEERAAYAMASLRDQREIRRLCMSQRRLWVRTTHTPDKPQAALLEAAMIHQYEDQGHELWNVIKYTS